MTQIAECGKLFRETCGARAKAKNGWRRASAPEAREARKELWADPQPVSPWE